MRSSKKPPSPPKLLRLAGAVYLSGKKPKILRALGKTRLSRLFRSIVLGMGVVSQPKKSFAAVYGRWLFHFTAVFAAVLGCAGQPAWAVENGIQPSPAPLPELVRTKHVIFSIPFRLPKVQAPDAATERVKLSVSKDLGGTWEAAGEVAPSAGAFTYRAAADGEYWFRLRAVDGKGRVRGGEGPDMRVLVDAAGPKLAARVWKGDDGEIICRYAAVDDSLRIDSLLFEYRGKGDQAWKKIAAEGILSRESPAHMVGEEIWWAGEQVDSITVRITISDSANNKTVRQFTLEATDPQVDQAALAQEIGAPPLPNREVPMQNTASDSASVVARTPRLVKEATASQSADTATTAWPAESASTWSAEPPTALNVGTGERSAAVKQIGAGDFAGISSRITSRTTAKQSSVSGPNETDVSAASETESPRASAASTATAAAVQPPLEYRGKPLQLVRSRIFAWDYEFEAGHTASEPMRAELWSTRDGGVTWQRSAVDDDTISPINVTLPSSGLYGFRLEMMPAVPEAGGGPRSGDTPDSWIGIDDEPPQVELLEITRAKTGEPGGILIRYNSTDQLLVPLSTRLLYSPHATGPWATIAESLETQGEHRWQPGRNVPARVFVRVESVDAAGNTGVAMSVETVVVTTSRLVGKLGSLRVLPAASTPAAVPPMTTEAVRP